MLPAMGADGAHLRTSTDTAESSLPPTPSTLASLRISTDTWSQLPDSPAGQFTAKQLLAAELEARNQALRLLLERRGGKPSVETELSVVSEGVVTPEAVTVSPRSSIVDSVFAMMDDKKLRTQDLFSVLDRDGGGTLDTAELKVAFAQHGMRLDKSVAENLLRLLDQDRDGKVDRREFVEQMRTLKNARRRRGSPEPEPEPEPQPKPEFYPHRQRPRTSRASKPLTRALTPQAAASAARLSGRGTSGTARSRLSSRPTGSALPPWVPGGASVRSFASSIGSDGESMSLSTHASRARGLASGRNVRTGAARHALTNGGSRIAQRLRPAWASPPLATTIVARSHGTEQGLASRMLAAMEANNLRTADLCRAIDRDNAGMVDVATLRSSLSLTLGVDVDAEELQSLIEVLGQGASLKDINGMVRVRDFAQQLQHASSPLVAHETARDGASLAEATHSRRQVCLL